MKWLWRSMAALVGFLLVLAVVGLGFLYSESGSRWMVALAQDLVPGLSVGRISGSLLSRTEIDDLSYSDQGVNFRSKRIELQWQPTELLRGRLHVQRLWLYSPGLALPPSQVESSAEPFSLPEEIALPITLKLDEVGLENGDLAGVRLDRLRLVAGWDEQGLRIEQLQVDAPQGEVTARAGMEPRQPYPLEGDLDVRLTLPDTPALRGRLALKGDLNELSADLNADGPLNMRVNALLRPDLQGGQAWARICAAWEALAWPPANIKSPAGSLSFEGTVEDMKLKADAGLAIADLPLRHAALSLDGRILKAGELAPDARLSWRAQIEDQPTLSGRGSVKGDLKRLQIEHLILAPLQLTTRGWLNLAEDIPGFDVSGDWTDLRWPLSGESEYRSPSGSYRLNGTAEAYRLQTSLKAEGIQVPELDATARIIGGSAAATVETLHIDTLGGNLTARGKFGWEPQLSWNATLNASKLQPGQQWPDWPGVLSTQAEVKGGITEQGLVLDAELRELSGQLRERPLAGRGKLSVRADRIQVQDLKLSSGDNRLALTGRLGPDLDAGFDIEASALDQLAGDLGGHLKGKGKLSGSYQAPQVVADLDGGSLRFQGYKIRDLDLHADIDPKNADASQANLKVQGANLDGFELASLQVDLDGNLARHRVSLAAKGDENLAVDLLAEGAYTEPLWQGKIERLRAGKDKLGNWRLQDSVSLTAGPEQVRADRLCILPEAGKLCIQGTWRAESGVDAQGDIRQLPLALAKPWLPPEVNLEGEINGSFAASGAADALRAQAELTPFDAAVEYSADDGEPLRAEFRNRKTTLVFRDQRLNADLDWQLGRKGEIRADLGLGAPDAKGARPLRGEVRLSLPDPSPISAFVPSLKELAGGLLFNASLAGSTAAPDIRLHGEWDEGRAALPDLGLVLENVRVKVDNDGDERYRLTASLDSGPGKLALDGDVSIKGEQWAAALTAKGDDFQVMNRPDVSARVSPDLNIKAGPESAEITGKIAVPHAKAVVAEVPKSAVTVSSDEVIVGEEAPEQVKSGGPRVSANVQIVLGKDVSLDAFGLKTNLGGDLRVRQRPGSQPQAVGYLELKNGKYEAYGQDLTIEQGRLLFSGPVDNPDLNLRAIRKAGDVTAGIRVQGPLRKPRSQVFSEPAMAEVEALSYLLTGGPTSGGGKADAAALAEAAVELGLSKAGIIGAGLGNSLGVDELTVTNDGGLDSSAVVIGKQLTPDLYLRYLYGLFERENEVQLQYRLSRSLSLEGSSGTNQAVDLIYSIETN